MMGRAGWDLDTEHGNTSALVQGAIHGFTLPTYLLGGIMVLSAAEVFIAIASSRERSFYA